MRHIAVIYKRLRPEALGLAREITHWLEDRKIRVFCMENPDKPDLRPVKGSDPTIPGTVDAVLVLGGDGTLLSVARLLEDHPIPVIGINLGGLGFLTEVTRESCYRELNKIIEGQYEIEDRMRLQVSVMREGKVTFKQVVLNDAVVNKAALARIIDLITTIDGRYLTCYRGDGLIVATPTGSTAYNLSAGGPIVYPTASAIIITPICSFTLNNRPIILPPQATITLELKIPIPDVTLTCDGQVGCNLEKADKIVISAAPTPLRLIKTPSINYFEILRTKLKWGLT